MLWVEQGMILTSEMEGGHYCINPTYIRGMPGTIAFDVSSWTDITYAGKIIVYNSTNGFLGYSIPPWTSGLPTPSGSSTFHFMSNADTSAYINESYSYSPICNVHGQCNVLLHSVMALR